MVILMRLNLAIGDENFVGNALLDLANKVHPLVLGEIFRSRQQIRDLASRLLNRPETRQWNSEWNN